MAIVRTDDKYYKAIADTLREHGLGDETFTPQEMPDGMIRNFNGHYETGKQAEYDAFWDNFQENGNRNYYVSSFGAGWTDETFRPKYNMQPTSASYMFKDSTIKDLKGILDESGIILDFSQCTAMTYLIQSAQIERLGIIDTTKTDSLSYLFSNGYKLKFVEKLILKEDGSQKFTNVYSFSNLINLEDIVIEGCIGMDTSFQWSTLLKHDSLVSIINSLKNYSGTSNTHTLTLGVTNLEKLSDEEKAIATEKGWTLA